jgi:hypothetical protein
MTAAAVLANPHTVDLWSARDLHAVDFDTDKDVAELIAAAPRQQAPTPRRRCVGPDTAWRSLAVLAVLVGSIQFHRMLKELNDRRVELAAAEELESWAEGALVDEEAEARESRTSFIRQFRGRETSLPAALRSEGS